MRARELMTTAVVTLSPDASIREVARVLSERGISGAPVVDDEGLLLGVVTEGDLIHRLAIPADRKRSWLRRLLSSPAMQAACYARTHGRRAEDLMTTKLVMVEEDAPAELVASLLERHGIRRLPVVRDGRVVGIISRADLTRAILAAADEEPLAGEFPPDDARIRRDLIARMREHPWIDPLLVFAEVKDGVVSIHGFYQSREVKRALRVLAEGVPGAREVRLDLTFARAPPSFMLQRA
jgi:CBS domain-containing protein